MSLNERRSLKSQVRSSHLSTSTSMQNYNNRVEELQSPSSASIQYGNHSFRSQGHGRASYHQQNSTNNNFYRQTSVAPRVLNTSYNDDQRSIQSASAYFGSGSNVGRGRPMTGDQ